MIRKRNRFSVETATKSSALENRILLCGGIDRESNEDCLDKAAASLASAIDNLGAASEALAQSGESDEAENVAQIAGEVNQVLDRVLNKIGDGTASDQPNPNAGPNVDPNAGPNVDPNAGPNVDPNAGPNLDPNAGPNLDPNAGPNLDPNAGPNLDPNAGPNLDPNAGPNLDPNADPNLDPNAGPNLDPNADPNLDPNADPNVDPNADPNLDPNADPNVDPNADPNLDPNADPNVDPNADPNVDPNADPNAPLNTAPVDFTIGNTFADITSTVIEEQSDGTVTIALELQNLFVDEGPTIGPMVFAVHAGDDSPFYVPGEEASQALDTLATTGDPSALLAEIPGSVSISSIAPGENGTVQLTFNKNDFPEGANLSVVGGLVLPADIENPPEDLFFSQEGSDTTAENRSAIPLFDASGTFVGRPISITGDNTWETNLGEGVIDLTPGYPGSSRETFLRDVDPSLVDATRQAGEDNLRIRFETLSSFYSPLFSIIEEELTDETAQQAAKDVLRQLLPLSTVNQIQDDPDNSGDLLSSLSVDLAGGIVAQDPNANSEELTLRFSDVFEEILFPEATAYEDALIAISNNALAPLTANPNAPSLSSAQEAAAEAIRQRIDITSVRELEADPTNSALVDAFVADLVAIVSEQDPDVNQGRLSVAFIEQLNTLLFPQVGFYETTLVGAVEDILTPEGSTTTPPALTAIREAFEQRLDGITIVALEEDPSNTAAIDTLVADLVSLAVAEAPEIDTDRLTTALANELDALLFPAVGELENELDNVVFDSLLALDPDSDDFLPAGFSAATDAISQRITNETLEQLSADPTSVDALADELVAFVVAAAPEADATALKTEFVDVINAQLEGIEVENSLIQISDAALANLPNAAKAQQDAADGIRRLFNGSAISSLREDATLTDLFVRQLISIVTEQDPNADEAALTTTFTTELAALVPPVPATPDGEVGDLSSVTTTATEGTGSAVATGTATASRSVDVDVSADVDVVPGSVG